MPPSTKPIGTPFIVLHTVESTNNYAMGLVHAGMAQHGTCVFAQQQTAGKGQRQRQWISGHGQNILMSLLLQPFGLKPEQQFLLSMATAVGTCRFFETLAGSEVRIKWPNDIYWRDRKAGGILIETKVQGAAWHWAVVGIGLNLNQTEFPGLDRKAVSLKQITGRSFNPEAMSRILLQHLQTAFEVLLEAPAKIVAAYQQALYQRQQPVRFRQGSRVFEAIVKEVLPTGELLVQHGVEECFAVGALEWLPASGPA